MFEKFKQWAGGANFDVLSYTATKFHIDFNALMKKVKSGVDKREPRRAKRTPSTGPSWSHASSVTVSSTPTPSNAFGQQRRGSRDSTIAKSPQTREENKKAQ
jgi:hypothetical protein